MSAPLRLTAYDLRRLSDALSKATEVTRTTQVRLDGYSDMQVRVTDDVVLAVRWDAEDEQYVIDDRSGS